MEAHHEMNRRKTVVKRAILLAISVLLALVVAAPMVAGQSSSGQSSSQRQNLGQLTGDWWNWAIQDPSPLVGSYTDTDPDTDGSIRCDGNFVDGVFFLAGALAGPPPSVERTCTVPAKTPILFPSSNVICSEAFTGHQPAPDPQPYDTACATPNTDDVVNPPSSFFARVDGKDAKQVRIASGIFQWTIPSNNPLGLTAGTYPAASDGLWVYLNSGLNEGNHTVEFGGHYEVTPFGTFEGTTVTYNLTATR
jgi:hypothetical protein